MSRIAYVNGRYRPHRDAAVHIEDRGYQFSDGVYEVCEVKGGRLVDERRHMERLQRSLAELRIRLPMTLKALSVVLHETIRRNRVTGGIVYLQITRGVARRDHGFPAADTPPAIVVTAKNLDPARNERIARNGMAVVTVPDNRWARVDIKSVSLLPNVLAKQAARESGAYEAWLIDGKGCITEGASTNAWIVTSDNELVTRQTDSGILAGITRGTLKKIAGDLQLKFVERPFTLAEAKKAKEAFITSATSFVTPVVRIDGDKVGDGKPGPTARRLREEYVRLASAGESVT